MTTKEQVIKTLLEDPYYKAVLDVQNVVNSQSHFDIAEMYAQGAINENPTETDVPTLAEKAINQIFASLGYSL